MQEAIVKVPNAVNSENINIFLKNFEKMNSVINSTDKVIFDFNKCKFISPAGIVVIAALRDGLNKKGKKTFANIAKSRNIFKFLNLYKLLNFEKEIDDDFIKNLSPYTVELTRCLEASQCDSTHKKIMDRVVTRTSCTKGTAASIDYMINEVWDNAGVHGYKMYNSLQYPEPIYICAFSFKNKVEVAILDIGQGIHQSLQVKSEYRGLSARDSLLYSIRNEVSGHPTGSPGFGLFSASELTKRNGGSLHILSSKRYLLLRDNKIFSTKGFLNKGTLVIMEINANIETDFESVIRSSTIEEQLELIEEYDD